MKLLLLFAYFAVLLYIGFKCRRSASSVSGFVLGGRSVGAWLTAFAYGTSYFSAVVFVGYAGQFGWKYGIAATWAGIGNALIGSLLAWTVLGRRTRLLTQHLGASTMPEFFGRRFDSRALKIVASVIIFVFLYYPLKKGSQKVNHMPWYDIVLMVVGAACFLYFCFGYDAIIAKLQVGRERLDAIKDCYLEILQEMFTPLMGKPWQVGYVGIDMMTYRPSGLQKQEAELPLCISPCVEMNLRCTMGVVCRLWYDEHLQEGVFRISPMEKDGHFKAQFLTHLDE